MEAKSSFQLVLEDGRGKSRAYTFTMNPPRNAKLLKAIVQRKFSIPTFCQEIYYESTKLKDETDLASFHIKEGDTFRVCYDTPADIRPVLKALKSLTEIVKCLEDEQHDRKMQLLVKDVACLWEKHFDEVKTKNHSTNKQLFIKRGGVELTLRVHTALLALPPGSEKDSPDLPLELDILMIWAMLCCTLNTAALKRVVKVVLGSIRRQTSIFDCTYPWKEIMWAGFKALYNLSETGETIKQQIASFEEDLHLILRRLEVLRTAYCNSAALVYGLFNNLSQCSSLHIQLTDPTLMKMLMDSHRSYELHVHDWLVQGFSACSDPDEIEARDIPRMIIAQMLAGLVTSSASVITLAQLTSIHNFLCESNKVIDFLKSLPRDVLHDYFGNWFGFPSIRNLLAMAYYPYSNPELSCVLPYYSDRHKKMGRELEQQCINVGLVNLYIALICKCQQRALVEEGMVDFVTCLPWCLPQGSRAHQQACEIVSHLREDTQLQPPSLLNIAKAKLAFMHFGLKKMLDTHSIQDLI